MSVTGTHSPAGGQDLDHRPSYLELIAKPDFSSTAGQVWLVTFTDLMALLLAFFVLLFAMSRIEQSNWQGLVEALASDLNSLSKTEDVKPALDYQAEEDAVVPGADLDYLAAIVREQIGAHPLLAQATTHRAAERLVISLPVELLFGAGAAEPTPQATGLGSALVSVLRHLGNAIEVEAQLERAAAAPVSRADWELALARAAAFTGILTRTGYTGKIVARATAAGGPVSGRNSGSSTSQGTRLDIVIHESARGQR